MNGFVDLIIEPILWFITSGIFYTLGLYFLNKLIKSPRESKLFFSGLTIFFLGWGTARLIETIRRYYVGNYYDIIECVISGNFTISGLNLILRLAYIIISWSAVVYFYFVTETIFLNKKSLYIFSIATIVQEILSVLIYFNIDVLILLIIFFLIVAVVPIIMFAALGIKKFSGQRGVWFILSLGLLFFVLGVAGDNPEPYMITQYINIYVIHYGTPIFVIIGMILIAIGVVSIYRGL
ncbi:MAG: hypothetical protein ACTSRP_19545 [Candidatus Helarchaeota archaeon]